MQQKAASCQLLIKMTMEPISGFFPSLTRGETLIKPLSKSLRLDQYTFHTLTMI